MDYAELLKKYIKESRLTLDEISDEIEKRGLTASKQYLSKLQNGKTPPASEKMNNVLAKITNGDSEKLNWYAYIEKAPSSVKDSLYILGDEILEPVRQLKEKFPGIFNNNFYEVDEIRNSSEYQEFLSLIKEAHSINQSYNKSDDAFDINSAENEKKHISYSDLNEIPSTIKVPVLGFIAAGSPVFAEEHIEDYMNVPNPGNFKSGELFMLKVKGDSMIGSRIHDGDKVLVKIQPDVENGDIAVVNVNGYEATLKKVKKLENGQVWLFPSNDNYDPILLDNEKARIIGKVIQVIFEPK